MTQERLITTSSQPGDIVHVNKMETFLSLKYECDFGHKHVYASLVNNIGCKFCPNYETSRSKCSRGKKPPKKRCSVKPQMALLNTTVINTSIMKAAVINVVYCLGLCLGDVETKGEK